MGPEVVATVMTGIGVQVGVWRLVEGLRRDLTQIATVNGRMTMQIAAINARIDNILLADRGRKS